MTNGNSFDNLVSFIKKLGVIVGPIVGFWFFFPITESIDNIAILKLIAILAYLILVAGYYLYDRIKEVEKKADKAITTEKEVKANE